MPINKAARLRLEILDECLRNTKKRWTKTELLNHVNRRLDWQQGKGAISASQLRYDLDALQTEFGAPVVMERAGNAFYYRYDDPSFSIRDVPIEEDDLQKLASAVQVLRQIQGFSIAEEIEEVVQRLERRTKYNDGGSGGPVIHFENSPAALGTDNLEDIYHAILAHTPLKIAYQSFRDPAPRVFHLHPYLLKEYAHRWYLLGWCDEKAAVTTLALDRMHEIKVARRPFLPNTFLDAATYFRDVIGVTYYPHQQVETVELLFAPAMAPYVQTKPLHGSQEVIQQYDDGSLQIRLRVYLNPELNVLLLGYGPSVKVLQPAPLADAMRDAAQATLDEYGLRG